MIRRIESPVMTFEAEADALVINFYVIGSTYGSVEVVLTPTAVRELTAVLRVYLQEASQVAP